MAKTIDDIAKTAQQEQEKKEEKKPKKSIFRSALEEIVYGAEKAAKLGIAASIPIAADQAMGGYDAAATATAFYAGAKKPRSAIKESIIGTAFATFAKYTFGPISQLSTYARAALVPAWQAVANAFYITTDHVVKNKTFTGLRENFKKNYTRLTKWAIAILSIPTFLTTYLPTVLQIPSIALQSFIFKKYIATDKKEKSEQKEKESYLKAIGNFGYKLFYAPLNILNYTSTAVRELYQSATKYATAQTPKTAPATQPA